MFGRSITALVGALVIAATAPAWAQEARRDAPPPPAAAPVLTKPPALLQSVAPEYPPIALAAGKTADVTVLIAIDADGLVTDVTIAKPVGDGFDEAAIAAAKQYIFDPAEYDGVPGPITVETVIHFVIDEVVEPPPLPPPPHTGPDRADPAAEGPPSHGGDVRLPISLAGQVVERGTRSAVSGAIVAIVELGLDAVTDDGGHFAFHGLAPGPYTVLVVADHHDRLERAVAIAARETVEVRLWMRPKGGSIYATVIEGEREVLEVTRRTIQREQLTSVPGTFGDPVRVIQTLPGVARTPFGLGLLLIRGSNPDDSKVYIDGHQVPLLFHFLGGPSVLNPEMLESIDLYPGGYPARFGRSHGGVVSLDTRAAKSDGIHGAADVDLLDAGGYIRAPIGKQVAVAVAGRRSYLDTFLDLVLPEPSPGSTRIVVPVYWDVQARVDWDGGAKGKATLFGIASADRLDVVQADAGQERSLQLNTAIRFSRLIGSYKIPFGDWSLTLSPAIGRDSIEFSSGQVDSGSPFTGASIIADIMTYRMRLKGPLRTRVLLDAGLDLDSRVTHYDALLPDDTNIRNTDDIDIDPSAILRSVQSLGVALHADLAIDATPKLRVLPGLRLDSYVIQAQPMLTLDPRLTARYQWTKTVLAKAYAGMFHQPPQPEAVDARFGNPDVRPELAYHVGLGGEWKPDRLWSFDGEIYYIWRTELIHFTSDSDVDGEGMVTPEVVVNAGLSATYGFEVLVKRELSETVFGWLSYTYSRSTQKRFDDSSWVPTTFDQTHNLNLVASWKPGGGWELGGRLRLSTGRPETPYTGATLDADSGSYAPLSGTFRAGRTPVFQQIDLRAEKTWLFKVWSFGLYLDIQNLLNASNVEATQWDYRYRESAPVSGIPFLPTLGVRGQW